MTREELITSPEYWIADIQTKLYAALEAYRGRKGLNRTQLAAELGFSKGYISQILNGDFDHRISKLVALSLKMGMAPELRFKGIPKAADATKPERDKKKSLGKRAGRAEDGNKSGQAIAAKAR